MKPTTSIHTVLARAGIFFTLLIAALLATTATAVYAGIKSGEINKRIIEPIQAIRKNMTTSFETLVKEEPAPTPRPINTDGGTTKSTSESTVIINNNGVTKTYRQTVQPTVKYIYPTYPPSKSYEQSQKEMDAWWAQVQADNKKLSDQSKAEYDAFKAQSEQNFQNAQIKGQQDLDAWRKEMEAKQKQFLLDHGITP